MLWSPNAMFGDGVDKVRGGYTPYWPGDEYVHICGTFSSICFCATFTGRSPCEACWYLQFLIMPLNTTGLSFYHWGKGAIRTNVKPKDKEAITKLYEFAQVPSSPYFFFSEDMQLIPEFPYSIFKIYGPGGMGKPIIVAETGE
jgi:hypothetical protein